MLHELQKDELTKPYIKEIRGLGLMVGIEFQDYPKIASKVQQKCLEKEMIVFTTSIFETLRLIPPLNITQEDMAKGCGILRDAIREVCKAMAETSK